MEYIEELLSETADESLMDVEKLKYLSTKLKEMNKDEKHHCERVDSHLQKLRSGLDEATGYLQKARKDLDNLTHTIVAYEETQAEVDNKNLEIFLGKSEEEIDAEMDRLNKQLEMLEKRVGDLNSTSTNAEESFNDAITELRKIEELNRS